MIIDCHVHLNNYHEGHTHPTAEHVRDLFSKMDQRGVDHAIVLTSYLVSADRPGVEEILELLKGNPRATVVEGLRWRGKWEDRTDLFALEHRARDKLVAGIKIYPGYEDYAINDPSLEAVFQVAARHKIPVMVHTGDTYSKTAKLRHAHPLLVDDVAVEWPEVNFVMCHLGSPWFHDAAEVLYKNDNVYGDLSGLALGEMSNEFEKYMVRRLKEMILHMGDPGAELLYGSDWPLVRMGPYVDFLESLKLRPEQMERIRWKNAAELFRIDVEASRRAAEEAFAKVPAESLRTPEGKPRKRFSRKASSPAAGAPATSVK